MKKGIRIGNEFIAGCKHCGKDYDLVLAKRSVKRTEPLRCPHCGCIVGK